LFRVEPKEIRIFLSHKFDAIPTPRSIIVTKKTGKARNIRKKMRKRSGEAERRRKEKDGNSFFSSLVVEVVPSPRADLTLEIFLLRFPNPPFYRYDSTLKKYTSKRQRCSRRRRRKK